jgi:ATP-dependent exoDNAse (exonuclease V) alpha subunit
LGLIYQNELALRVQELGYQITAHANGTFDIKGYTEEQLRGFSKRRVQLEDLGVTNQKEARTLVKVNRPTKGPEVSRDQLLVTWNEEARGYGISHPTFEKKRDLQLKDPGQAVEKAMIHAGERDVRFRREDMERFALENHLGKVHWNGFQKTIENEKGISLLPTVDQRWTTRQALVTESKILGHLDQGKGSFQPLLKEFPRALEAVGLTEGQKEALKSSFLTKDQFTAWQGVAGSGKTFALRELGLEVEKKGHRIFGFAPSAEAAKVLEAEAKISSQTVASLLKGASERGIWIVDEAGLLSARDCESLMAKARESQSKVIFVGDTRQLSSVEAGNPFKLMQQNGIETAFLSESRRQKTVVLKKAAEALAKGEMTDGLKQLERSIYEFKREDTRVRHVAADFLALDPGERSKTLVLAGTNRERGLITEEIRSGLKKERVLGAGTMLQSLVPKDLTKEEIKAGAKIEAGDVLVFHRKDQGFLKGDQRTVLGKKGNEFELEGQGKSFELKGQETFTVYRSENREFSVGDKVRWTRNDKGLRNGEEFWVAKADKDGLRLMNTKGKEVTVNGRAFLDHAYVSTVYASQGKTAERVLISTDHTFGRESVYVAVTRAKSEVKIYTEDKGKMMGRAEVSQAKVSASQVLSRGRFF